MPVNIVRSTTTLCSAQKEAYKGRHLLLSKCQESCFVEGEKDLEACHIVKLAAVGATMNGKMVKECIFISTNSTCIYVNYRSVQYTYV